MRNLLSHSSGGWQSEIKVSVGLRPSEGHEAESVLCFFPRANSLEKTLMLGKIEGRKRRGWQRTRWLDGLTDSMSMSLSRLWEMMKRREACSAAVHGVPKSWTQLSNWTTATNGNSMGAEAISAFFSSISESGPSQAWLRMIFSNLHPWPWR